jgi:serine protease AprX
MVAYKAAAALKEENTNMGSGRVWRHWAVWGFSLALLAPTAMINADNSGHGRSARARTMAQGKGSTAMDVLVRFKEAPKAAERSMVKGLGGLERRKLSASSRWLSVRVPANRVATLAAHDSVDFVTTDEPVMNFMELAREAANHPVAPAPETALTGAGVTIAVLDSGVALHPDIQTLTAVVDVVGNPSPSVAPPQTSIDPYGHGTHVAGIMVGNGSHSGGHLAGVAPGASLISVRVLDGVGAGQASDVLAGLQWVQDHQAEYGIRVVNLSLGHPVVEPGGDDPLVQAVDALWDAGIVVVCSAGNRGQQGHVTITSPCNSRKVITVGATNISHTGPINDDKVATYSSRGPTTFDLVAKPDLVAPGNRIVSLRAAGSVLDVLLDDRRVAADPALPTVQEYFEMSGTSMASPIVAGTAALMLEQDPTLNPGSIKARLMMTARKAKFGDPLVSGAGYLDITAALRATWSAADAPSPLSVPDELEGKISFENTAGLWGNEAFSLRALWEDSIGWADPNAYLQPFLETTGETWVPNGQGEAAGEVWPNSVVWAESEVWPDCSAWGPALTAPQQTGPVMTEALAAGFRDE